jgi:hypothetical protein
MLPIRHRNWNKAAVAKGRNTVAMGNKRGTDGSLTFSIPTTIAREYLQKYGDGLQTIHMKIIKKSDGFLLVRSKPEEWGRKFSPGGVGMDYRIFYGDSSYDWIPQMEPFGSTPTDSKIMDGGIWVGLPPVDKRNALMPYRPHTQHLSRRASQRPPSSSGEVRSTPPSAAGEAGHMYLVMVPSEKDEQFHTLLRFLKLEALKE